MLSSSTLEPFEPSMLCSRRNGFTLVEVLLSIAFVAFLAGVSVPLWQDLQVRNDLDVAEQQLVANMRRAQLLAQANVGDNPWGVKVQTGSITIFQGQNFAARMVAADEVLSIPTTIAFTGWSEVVFSKVFGEPSITGNLILTTVGNEIRTLTINPKGVVNY